MEFVKHYVLINDQYDDSIKKLKMQSMTSINQQNRTNLPVSQNIHCYREKRRFLQKPAVLKQFLFVGPTYCYGERREEPQPESERGHRNDHHHNYGEKRFSFGFVLKILLLRGFWGKYTGNQSQRGVNRFFLLRKRIVFTVWGTRFKKIVRQFCCRGRGLKMR